MGETEEPYLRMSMTSDYVDLAVHRARTLDQPMLVFAAPDMGERIERLKAQGIDRFWSTVEQFRTAQAESGRLDARRRHQSLAWMWERIESGLKQRFRQDAAVRKLLPGLTEQVEQGQLAASTAARQLLAAMDNGERHA